MSHILLSISPERQLSDDNDELEIDKLSPYRINQINFDKENEEIQQLMESVEIQIPQLKKCELNALFQVEREKSQHSSERNEFIQQDHSKQAKIENYDNLNFTQLKCLSHKKISTPDLFEDYNSMPITQLENNQQVISLKQLKESKNRDKSLTKWNSNTKMKMNKENDKPTLSRQNSQKHQHSNNKLQRQSSTDKYKHVESKVKLLLNQYEKCAKPIPNEQKKLGQQMKPLNHLNISQIDQDQGTTLKCESIKRNMNNRVEDQSMIQDLIDLDLSFMINNINSKKEFLLNKIKSIQTNDNIDVDEKKQKLKYNNIILRLPIKAQRSGSIVKNTKKAETSFTKCEANQEIGLIDLYANMIAQKQKRNQVLENTGIRSQSVNKSQIRQPGKIARKNNLVNDEEITNQQIQNLEDKYKTLIDYAASIKKQITNAKVQVRK